MDEFDYVIVGAGSAGCVLGGRLSENPRTTVLLLEAGDRDRNPKIRIPAAFPQLFQSRLDWAYRTEEQAGLDNRRVYWPRGKVLGGSSSINAMMWIRGIRADYDRWGELAGSDWSYEAVLPYFLRAEDTAGESNDPAQHGSGGPLPISHQRDPNPLTLAWLRAAEEAGIKKNDDPNNGKDDGVCLAMVNQRSGRRVSTADAYLRPARGRANLAIETNAECERIVFDGRRAIGIEYRKGGRLITARVKKEVLCCAGAIGSPTLLMRSGVGPASSLSDLGIPVVADRSEVGNNLQDHLTAGIAFSSPAHGTLAQAQGLRAIARYLASRRGLLSSNVAEAYGFVRSSSRLDHPDLELVFVPGPFLDEGLTLSRDDAITVGAVLLKPVSRGEIRLASKDAKVAPRIDPRYLSDPQGIDAALLTAGVCLSLQVLRSPAIADMVGKPIQPAGELDDDLISESVRRYSQTLYHPAGTCRMGIDAHSVVDGQLRVRSVDGVRVIDASVIPELIRGHTHAPTVMIAEKGADLVRRN